MTIWRIIQKLALLSILTLIISGCLKDEFKEPPDPFEIQRLEEGFVGFQFGNGADSFKILTNHENVTITDKGNIRIRGTLFADRDTLAPVRLSQGDFILLKNMGSGQETANIDGIGDVPISRGSFKMMNSSGSGYEEFIGFGGYSEFTLPQVGIMQELSIDQPDGTNIYFGQGSDLPDDFPVNPNRTYFYFYYEDLVDFALGKSPFMIDRMALDPDDPYFYVHASAMSIPGLSSLEDGGFAASVQGNIPFSPQEALSFGDVESFDYGNLLLQGSVNLETTFGVPLVVADATAVIGFGNMTDGVNFFNGDEVPFMMGLQGGFVLALHDLAEFTLGEAAVSLEVYGYDDFEFRWAGWFSNEMRVMEPIEQLLGLDTEGTAWDFIQPPGVVNELKTWGTIGTDPDNWSFGIHTTSKLKISNVMTIDLGEVRFELAQDELDFFCRMRVGFFGHMSYGGYIHNDGAFKISASADQSIKFDLSILVVKVGYDVGFYLQGYSNGDWKFCVNGKAYLDISFDTSFFEAHPEILEDNPDLRELYEQNGSLKGEISASLSACLNSSGKFKGKISFSFWKVGYSYNYSFSLNSSEASPLYNFKEVPLEEVPLENRFGSNEIVR
ncbi:MAG: hypothetical protein KAH17_02025 [Bacteroidales bacterium]|nr:hypothetical protein [Bacteroidales bacterium]